MKLHLSRAHGCATAHRAQKGEAVQLVEVVAVVAGILGQDNTRRIAGRLAATASIFAWCGVIFAGRFIAYTQAG